PVGRLQASLRDPRYWNDVFQIGPGPAKLVIDGPPVLDLNANVPVLRTTVALARGVHSIDYTGTRSTPKVSAQFLWAAEPEHADPKAPVVQAQLEPARTQDLMSTVT